MLLWGDNKKNKNKKNYDILIMTTIKTNNQPRTLHHIGDYPESEQAKIRKEYSWMEPEDIDCNFGFFNYRGQYYHLSEFSVHTNPDFSDWHGFMMQTVYDGVLIKVSDDGNEVTVGRYFD